MAKHLVKNWRGSRGSYNYLKALNMIDTWTKYYVIDNDGNTETVTEDCGLNPIDRNCCDYVAVNDILATAPSNPNPYDRFLVGDDLNGYQIYEYTPIKDSENLDCSIIDFDWKHGVRVRSRGLKCYVYYNNKLITYDDVDCGEF